MDIESISKFELAVSVDDIGICDCGEVLVQRGIWGSLANGGLHNCKYCEQTPLPIHFGIIKTEYGYEREGYLAKDGRWSKVRPTAKFALRNVEVRVSMDVKDL